MAKKFLNRSQIGTIAKKVRCKGVTEGMWGHVRRQVQLEPQRLDKSLRGAGPEGIAARTDEKGA